MRPYYLTTNNYGYYIVSFVNQETGKKTTYKSTHTKDYNQAIFCDYGRGEHEAVWANTTMEMVLQCFDDAVKDWRKSFCDVKNCHRPK